MGVKNKYCTPCARALGLGEEPKQHTCYKNWGVGNRSSNREPAIISDGFACSVKMYYVKYAHLIADGNGSVYKRILENMPCKTQTVEKIECKNHLLRNFCNKLRQISAASNREKNTVLLKKNRSQHLTVQDSSCNQSNRLQKKPRYSKNPNKVKELRLDILSIPNHVFSEHKRCKERGYFGTESPTTTSSKIPCL